MTVPDQDPSLDTGRPDSSAPTVGAPPEHEISRSRLGGLWVAMSSGAVVLLLLLIFVLENGRRVDVAYFSVHAHLPLGVALLLAAVFGVLLVVVPGGGRMLQLRRAARRHSLQDRRDAAGPSSTATEPEAEPAVPRETPDLSP